MIKPHAHDLLARVIFPLMCFTEEDTTMWQDDPIEWILCRTDIHNDFLSSETAAQYLLHTLCRKHPNLLPDILQFVLSTLGTEGVKPSDKDGALHFFGKLNSFRNLQFYNSVFSFNSLIIFYVF